MKKLFVLLSILMLVAVQSYAQGVSIFVGASTNENTIYGAEFKSKTIGCYVGKYNSEHNYPKYVLPPNQLKAPTPDNVLYDGVMFGVSTHIKSMGNIVISTGIGILNEYVIYGDWQNMYSMDVNQKFAMEIGAGRDFNAGDNIIIGIRGGVNNCTNLFGTISIGFNLNQL
jgi:hypothetical protein